MPLPKQYEMRSQQGVSLIELMVVVGVVGILAAVGVPRYIDYLGRAKQVGAKANLDAISTDEQAFYNANNSYSDLPTVGFVPNESNAYQYSVTLFGGGYSAVAVANSADAISQGCGVADEWVMDQDHVLCAVFDCFMIGPFCSGGGGAAGAAAATAYHGGCFTAGTPVATPSGPRPIETLVPGDLVLSLDFASGMEVPSTVVARTIKRSVPVVHLTLSDGRQIDTTEEHPFYSLDFADWVEVRNLSAGENLVTMEPMGPPISVATLTETDSLQDVYDLTVENEHNYFVNGILVHNKTYVATYATDNPAATAAAAAAASAAAAAASAAAAAAAAAAAEAAAS